MRDTKQAEKDYLRRAASANWERAKPFSAPGASINPAEAADLIHDFAVMLRMLAPHPGDVILDLGAGGCWVSEWLSRLDVYPVSMDIAFDMLRLGRERLAGRGASLVAGDMETLPFASNSFDHACCLSALHHVPSIPAALREICRVVRPTGRVAFLEPGSNHSSLPASQAAMRDFGVLEQDIVLSDFMQQCTDAGFAYVQVLPLSYAVTGLGLTRTEWLNWQRAAHRKRPLRAVEKMGRGVLELFGLARAGALAEESWSIHLARTIRKWVEGHPVVLAHRTIPNSMPEPIRYGCEIELRSAPAVVHEGDPVSVRVASRNTGNGRWGASLRRPVPIRLGMQLLSADGAVMRRDFVRASLPHDVMPGEACELVIECIAPAPGSYRLKIDMVAEGVNWFEERGSRPCTVPLDVAGSPGPPTNP